MRSNVITLLFCTPTASPAVYNMSFASNHRSTIDSEVYKWVVQQLKKKKVVTPNAIRQKAFEIGQEFDPNFKASINWYNNWKKRFDYNESPEAEALKHKKRSYTAAFKLHAVQRAMELESASQASLELDVSRRCLQRWKEELDVITSVAEHSSNAVYRRPGQGRKVRDSGLDTQLLEWVRDCWKQGISLSSIMIREKARELSPQLEFKASLGWFVKWQKRHCVDLKEQTCNPMAGEVMTPLKLRLLPEGEMSAYSTPKKRRLSKKKALNYDSSALLENDEEFDRLLLTWLVERWEAGDIVNDKMLKERAMELTANPDFKASKVWLTAWKGKYNVSLENQTYGTEGDEENEEIVEETPVYDEQVLIEGEQPEQQQGNEEGATENPLTPAKEEAATALASLSADDHEIAEALQKLASAFGITTQCEEGSGGKENVTQLAALQQSDNPEFLLEGGQVAVEEVVSEEVVTDEPLVVIEGTDPSTGVTEMQIGATGSEDMASSTVQSIVDVVSAATQIAQSITGSNNPSVTQPVAESLIQAVANQLNQTGGVSAFTTAQLQGQETASTSRAARLTPAVSATSVPSTHTPSTTLTVTTIPTPSSSLTITTSPYPASHPTLLGPSVFPSSSLTITTTPLPTSTLTISTTPTPSSTLTIATTPAPSLTPMEGPSGGPLVPHSSAPFVTEEVIISGSAEVTEQVEVTVEGDMVMEEGESVTGDPSDTIVQLSGTGLPEHTDVHIAMVTTTVVSTANELGSEVIVTSSLAATGPGVRTSDLATSGSPEVGMAGSAPELVVAVNEEIPLGEGGSDILEGGTDILGIVQETIVGEGEEGGVSVEGGRSERVYEDDFKVQVVHRARELGSVQLAAREFSVPWKVVASWNTGE